MESSRRRYPEEYKEMVQFIAEYAKNRPNLLEYVQIDGVLKKTTSNECDSMHSEVIA